MLNAYAATPCGISAKIRQTEISNYIISSILQMAKIAMEE